jgi:hypothetical protein
MKTIPLQREFLATVDDEDYERVRLHRWNAVSNSYGKLYVRSPQGVYLHRFIVDAPHGLQVDHINGDVFDNRRSNLRLCTHGQNQCNRGMTQANTSGFKGVFRATWCKDKWVARIKSGGRITHLGSFGTPEDAARAYDAAAKSMHGDFARTNFS